MEARNKFEDERSALEMVAKHRAEGDNNNKVMMFERERSEMVEYLQTVDSIIQRFRHNASLETAETTARKQLLDEFLDLHRILNTTLRPCILLEVPRDDPLLIEAAKVSFQNFERAVNSEISHISSLQEGGVHTTTNYVMDYIMRLISEYGEECEWIVSGPRKVEISTRINGGNICEKKTIDGSGLSPFASHVLWVIASLLRRLKSKTVQHQDDDAFAQFFMMNNLNYIVQTVNEQPSLREIVEGGDFLRDLETGLFATKLKYLGSTWTKIVQALEQCSSPKKIKLFNVTLFRQSRRRKEILRNFNEMFGKIHQTQSRWSGSDANLMRQLRKVILDRLVPSYEHLLQQLSDSSSCNPITAIQYSVEDVKKAISQLFQGRPPTSFQ
nr:exocyst complex component EXO70A1-like [Ipomoea batatas]